MFVNFHLTLWGGDLGRLWALGWLWLQGAQPLKSSSLAWTAPKRNPAETERSTFSRGAHLPPPFPGLAHSVLPTNSGFFLSCFTHSFNSFHQKHPREGHSTSSGLESIVLFSSIYYFLSTLFFNFLYGSFSVSKDWSRWLISLPWPSLHFRFSCVSVLPDLPCRLTLNTGEYLLKNGTHPVEPLVSQVSQVRLLSSGWNTWPFASSLITIALISIVWGCGGQDTFHWEFWVFFPFSQLKAETPNKILILV